MTSLLNEYMNKFGICKRPQGVVRNMVAQATGSHDPAPKKSREITNPYSYQISLFVSIGN